MVLLIATLISFVERLKSHMIHARYLFVTHFLLVLRMKKYIRTWGIVIAIDSWNFLLVLSFVELFEPPGPPFYLYMHSFLLLHQKINLQLSP